jgi:hypothetical protein
VPAAAPVPSEGATPSEVAEAVEGTEGGGEVPGVEELGRAPAGPVPSEVATPPPSAEEVSRVTRAVNISLKSAFV